MKKNMEGYKRLLADLKQNRAVLDSAIKGLEAFMGLNHAATLKVGQAVKTGKSVQKARKPRHQFSDKEREEIVALRDGDEPTPWPVLAKKYKASLTGVKLAYQKAKEG